MTETHVMCFVRGRLAYSWDDGEHWYWADDGVEIPDADAADSRSCACCGEMPTEAGHDACLGHLPGVASACCGHGVDKPYLQFEDEDTFRAIVRFLKLMAVATELEKEGKMTVGRLPQRKTQGQWDRELDAALDAQTSMSDTEKLEKYKALYKALKYEYCETALELQRVQRKSRRHRENIRNMQRALRVAQLENEVMRQKMDRVIFTKDASEARAEVRDIKAEMQKAARSV